MMDYFKKELRRLSGDNAVGAIPADSTLSILKFNTPGSITGLYAKVIFLAFRDNAREPFACIKTVRKAEDNFLITDAHTHLTSLHEAVKGTGCEEMFPKPIGKGEYDGIVYSVESAMTGRRYEPADYKLVLDAISRFQTCVGRFGKTYRPFADELRRVAGMFGDWSARIVEYGMKLPGHEGDIRLIPQHGDITPDNLFIERGRVRIFDCEQYGTHEVAGFDLYHFLERTGKRTSGDVKSIIDQSFSRMQEKPLSTAHYFLLYLTDLSIKAPFVKTHMKVEDVIHRFS